MKNSLTYKKYSRVKKYDLNFLYVKKIQQDSKFCFLDPDCFRVDLLKSPKWCNLGNPQDKIHVSFFSNRSSQRDKVTLPPLLFQIFFLLWL